MTGHFFLGFSYFLRGFGIVKLKALRPYLILPLLINIVFYVAIFWLGNHYFVKFTNAFLHFLPHWLSWLTEVLWALFVMMLFLILYMSFNIMANLFAAPFNGLLAEKLQLILNPASTLTLSKDTFIELAFKAVKRQLQFMLYYLPRLLGLLVLFCIPIIHLVFPILWVIFNAWMMCLQYLEYPMDNNNITFEQNRKWMQQHKQLSYGFGFAVSLFNLIPFINFIIIPMAVGGATNMWLETYLNERQHD